MDYFNGNGMEESISINDMIECDMRCNFNEHLGGNGDSQSGFPGMGSILDYDINSLDMTDSKATLASLISMNGADLNWMNTLNLTTFTKTENSDPNLMVNPQTGMPISCEQSMSTDTNAMLSAQTPNMNESAVREALLRRTPDPTTFVAVAPSQVQQPPQYIQQQVKQEPQQNNEPEPTRQPQQQQSSNSQTIRQHLQAQVAHSLPSPQSPGSPYPDISSPQPMVVNSPQKSHPTPKSVVMTDVDKIYPKPVYSYSCLIAMALKNSDTGCLPVSEIYTFMTENFPYFKTAPDGWKNSVRHNLSLNKCFEKIENPKSTGTTKKGCLWAMNPAKIEKMEEEIAKWRKKDPIAIKRSMSRPEVLDLLEAGNGGCRSPHHNLSTATSTNNNNNITKPTTPITTTTAPSEMRLSKVVTNISANVNVIEIKPIKMDQTAAGGAGGATVKEELTNLTPDELSVLDNNILDPAINDMAIQNGLFGAVMFDDFNSDELNLEDFQNGGSPLSFTLSSAGLTASPIHFNAGAASGTGNFIVTPNIDEKGAIQTGFNLFNCTVPSAAPSTPASKYTLARTVTAQT